MNDIQHSYQPTPKSLVAATADQISGNVYNAGSAVKLFEGFGSMLKLFVTGKTTAGAVTQVRARLLGADDAALTVNAVVIADTGLGAAMTNGTSFHKEAAVNGQTVAKQYYGIFFDTVGAAGTADVVGGLKADPQNNMPYKKQAVP